LVKDIRVQKNAAEPALKWWHVEESGSSVAGKLLLGSF